MRASRAAPPRLLLPELACGSIEGRRVGAQGTAAAISSVIDIDGRLGHAGAKLAASLGGAVQHAVSHLPMPFRNSQICCHKLPLPLHPLLSPASEGAAGLSVQRAAVDMLPCRLSAMIFKDLN